MFYRHECKNARPAWFDAAACAAYGQPHGLSNEEILVRRLALNLERAGWNTDGEKKRMGTGCSVFDAPLSLNHQRRELVAGAATIRNRVS